MKKSLTQAVGEVKDELEDMGSTEASQVADLLDSLILDGNEKLYLASLDELISYAKYAKKEIEKKVGIQSKSKREKDFPKAGFRPL